MARLICAIFRGVWSGLGSSGAWQGEGGCRLSLQNMTRSSPQLQNPLLNTSSTPFKRITTTNSSIMWRRLRRREKPPPTYEQGPVYYYTSPGPWQQDGYYQEGTRRGYLEPPANGPENLPARRGRYAVRPYGPYGPGPYPRRYYVRERRPQPGFYEALLATLACCCCLGLWL